ncbi:MAG: carboxymuconolactone decarboxylase family protein [Halobacteriaceae archaeon]
MARVSPVEDPPTADEGDPSVTYPNLRAALGNNPAALAAADAFIDAAGEAAGLDDEQRELVVLAVAAELSSQYLWHHHVQRARDRGVSDAAITGIAHFDGAPFDDGEAALIRYARAVARGQVTDRDHRGVAAAFEASTVVGACVLAGVALWLARVSKALDIGLEADSFVGWDPA